MEVDNLDVVNRVFFLKKVITCLMALNHMHCVEKLKESRKENTPPWLGWGNESH